MEKIFTGRIEKDGRLKIAIAETDKKSADKPIQFAAIPKFDQLSQAVYQSSPVDRGKYIEAGVEVREVPREETKEFEAELTKEKR